METLGPGSVIPAQFVLSVHTEAAMLEKTAPNSEQKASKQVNLP